MGQRFGDLCLNLTFWVSVSCSALIAHAGIGARDTSLKSATSLFCDVSCHQNVDNVRRKPTRKKKIKTIIGVTEVQSIVSNVS